MKQFACKALLNKSASSSLGKDWVTAKRCMLKVTDKNLDVAGVIIPFSEVTSADLRIVPSAFFIPGCILTVCTVAGETHHFGLSYSSFWKGDLPFPVSRTAVTVPLLWPRRLIILGTITWLLWRFLSPPK